MKIMTEWGEKLDRNHPLQEYPRPQMERSSYLNLNGVWNYAITKTMDTPSAYDGEIVVPFSPECVLSGVEKVVMPDDVLHYEKTFEIFINIGYKPLTLSGVCVIIITVNYSYYKIWHFAKCLY